MTAPDSAGRLLGPDSGADGVELVRSEERLHLRTARVPVERVRLIRRIVTETRTVQVQVRREELHVDRTPIAGGESAPPADSRTAGRDLVLLLSEEVPVVTMTTRPVERVHVRIETATGSQSVIAALRREQISVDNEPLSPY